MYKRVLLKLSGEALSDKDCAISHDGLNIISREIAGALKQSHAQMAVVVGAGNLWRGADKNIDRVPADQIGMLATLMNAIALKESLLHHGIKAEVFSARGVSGLVKQYRSQEVKQFLSDGFVCVLGGGTGNPYFTTDSGAALRAAEIEADIVLKATQIDGVYDDDPKKNPHAKKFDELTFAEALDKHLRIMDQTAFALCNEANIKILVFDFHKTGNLARALSGEKIGSIISK